MSDFDTGDIVRWTKTGEEFTVACCHEEQLYTMGNPSRTLHAAQCELIHRADSGDRLALLRGMADVKSGQHRPVCARQRLLELGAAATNYDSGCC